MLYSLSPDHEVASLGDPDPLAGGRVQDLAILEPRDLWLRVAPGRLALEHRSVTLRHLGGHRHHPEVLLHHWNENSLDQYFYNFNVESNLKSRNI